MGILGILRDYAGSLGDSRGFSGFLEKVYEVSEVSNPSVSNPSISRVFSSIAKIDTREIVLLTLSSFAKYQSTSIS